ncbi:hypothetical protein HN587_00535 [Candidatus Woesearchaeota archaeon]|mgnify:CR=1 FL=1|jgi:hypothetical protein|nr:hypothetical protein [Candidatus Woesearchaeota archaeon]
MVVEISKLERTVNATVSNKQEQIAAECEREKGIKQFIDCGRQYEIEFDTYYDMVENLEIAKTNLLDWLVGKEINDSEGYINTGPRFYDWLVFGAKETYVSLRRKSIGTFEALDKSTERLCWWFEKSVSGNFENGVVYVNYPTSTLRRLRKLAEY